MGDRPEHDEIEEHQFRGIVGLMDTLRLNIEEMKMTYGLTQRFDIVSERQT